MESEKEMEMQWEETSCLKGQILLRIQEKLKEPSNEKIKEKFPYQTQPQEIYMDEDGKIIFTLNLLEKQLEEGQLYSAVREMQRMINHIYPESIRNHARCMKVPAGMLGWLSFLTGGLSDDNCHIMFLMPVSGKMMLGSYHFSAGLEQEEKENFFRMARSIQVIGTEQEKDTSYGKRVYGQNNSHT